jgi:conjugal transfer pilus assembly protein TraW
MNKYFLVLIVILGNQAVFAKDFGKQGASFEIKEEGFVAMIKRKLANVNMEEQEKKMQELAKKRVEEPTAVDGITRTKKQINHSFDPSYILDQDVYLPSGKLLYAAGTTINPLDHMSWEGKLVFIDSRDRQQIEWVKKSYFKELKSDESEENLAKIILVAGRPLDLEQELEKEIYFDQFGELTSKFNIAHVPATVEQDGKYLKVTEVYIGEKK